jgi:iron-sulfur cluster repair protein YtfE (RIC family)
MTALLPGQAAAPEGPADVRRVYVLHHGLRRDLASFTAATRATPASDAATWRALLRRWDLFAAILRDHHRKEDEILWPYLRDRAAQANDLSALKLLEDMETDHAIVDPLLSEARRALERQISRPLDLDRAGLVAIFEQLAAELDDHLSHEEREALAILQRYVGDRAWADLERGRLRGRLPLGVQLHIMSWGTSCRGGVRGSIRSWRRPCCTAPRRRSGCCAGSAGHGSGACNALRSPTCRRGSAHERGADGARPGLQRCRARLCDPGRRRPLLGLVDGVRTLGVHARRAGGPGRLARCRATRCRRVTPDGSCVSHGGNAERAGLQWREPGAGTARRADDASDLERAPGRVAGSCASSGRTRLTASPRATAGDRSLSTCGG